MNSIFSGWLKFLLNINWIMLGWSICESSTNISILFHLLLQLCGSDASNFLIILCFKWFIYRVLWILTKHPRLLVDNDYLVYFSSVGFFIILLFFIFYSYVYFKFVMIFEKHSVTGAMPFHMLKF